MFFSSSVRRIFERGGGGPENLNIIKTKRKIFPLRISPFSCPKLGDDQKKRSSLKISPLFAPKLREDQKKGLYPDSVFLCAQTFSPSYKGGACRNFAYYSMLIILSWRPKGGAMAPCLPPKHAPVR